jgi:arsenite oxidase small subunit
MAATLTRRKFVQVTILGTATAITGGKAQYWFAPSLPYPAIRVGSVASLKPNEAAYFNYPDAKSQGILVKLGRSAVGGVGAGRDIVAYSAACTHMGCGVQYKGGRFFCPCHYSMFDPAKNGQNYQGLASTYLPQIQLRVDGGGNIFARAMEGLIWGRARNI